MFHNANFEVNAQDRPLTILTVMMPKVLPFGTRMCPQLNVSTTFTLRPIVFRFHAIYDTGALDDLHIALNPKKVKSTPHMFFAIYSVSPKLELQSI